tara:strand:+ start:93 stop:521 length:429 start_codon:yes stop_codon:yes gene_type:complete
MHKLLNLFLVFVSSLACSAEPVMLGSKSIDPMSTANLAQWTVGLIFVLLMIIAIAWVAKRFAGFSGNRHTGQLKILSGISLGSREKALLIRAGQQYILLGVAPGRVENLHTFAAGEISEETTQTPSGFQESLQKMMNKKQAE